MRPLAASVCLLATLVAASPSIQAQTAESYLELLRSDVRTEKVAIITEVMAFTAEQSSAFWPLYREYEVELGKLGDERLAVIKDYAKHYENMTDEIAKQLVDRSFSIEESRTKLQKKYYKKFEKVISSIDAARLMQLERQLNLLIDLQIASELPLIDRTGSEPGSTRR